MKDWIKWLLLGLASIAFGVFALGNAVLASLAVTTITGALFLIIGAFQLVSAVTSTESTGSRAFNGVLGALMALLGLSFLFNPLEGVVSLAMLVLILLAVSGIVRIFLASRMRSTRYFWAMLISGALSLFLAAYILVNFATVALPLLGILLGIELLFNGVGLVVLAFFVREAGHAPGK